MPSRSHRTPTSSDREAVSPPRFFAELLSAAVFGATVLTLIGCCTCPDSTTPNTGTAPDTRPTTGAANSATAAPLVRSGVPDGINDRFLDPALDADAWVNRWEVESREIYVARDAILAAAGLGPGNAVADVGAGTGLFVAPFSEAVGPEGRVYAIDIAPKFIEHLTRRTHDEDLTNVEVVLSRETSTELPAESVDIVFTCDTYHHFEYHEAMLASIHRALRPGGRLVVVDFERIPGVSRDWILGHVRAGKKQVRSEIEKAGFRYEREVDIPALEENYVLRFIRP